MRCLTLIALLLLVSCGQSENPAPKNVILLIGDGMGDAEISLARNYQFDGGDGLFIDTMDLRGSVVVNALRDSDPNTLAFVGDSASGGTVLATGKRTAVRRISTTAKEGLPLKTIAEEAKEKGINVGLVTTAVITDATPATFGAHVNNRYCMKPGDKTCGNDRSIIEQMLDLEIDVMLGGGDLLLPAINNGKTVEQMAKDKGYKIIRNREELLSFNDKESKVWGIFSAYNMPVEWQNYNGTKAQKLALNEKNKIIFPTAQPCRENPNHKTMPTLEQMALTALKRLSSNSDKGFFLMIEGASIDKQAHMAMACGVIGEMLSFDNTVKMAVDFAKKQGNTLVIVTADHGGPSQNIHSPYYENYDRSAEQIPGLYEFLRSKGGNELSVYYATNNITDQAHTGINVPIYSYGLKDDNTLRGTIKQTQIKGVMAKYLFQ